MTRWQKLEQNTVGCMYLMVYEPKEFMEAVKIVLIGGMFMAFYIMWEKVNKWRR